MKQFSGTSNYALDHPSLLTESVTTVFLDNVEQTSVTIQPTIDPLNVMGQVGGVVISLMIVIGVVGNLLVFTAIVQCPQLRRSYNAFIASLSVTDLIFNITVMPFYVDAYVHRQWRFSDDVCRWHTFFGTTVIVSSSLHIALIATSRYHVIVHPRFYDRWLSSAVAVASQIVFAWVVAVALVLPGVVGVLPITIGWSDQLSRCNYDRVASYGALSVVFCVGFIVPCVVMGYCYCMIWRQTREVGLRLDSYSAFRLLKKRQQNGESVFAANCQSPLSPVPSSAHVIAHKSARSEPLMSAENNLQPAREDDKIADVYMSTSEHSWDKDRHADFVIECPQGTDADCRERLLPVVDHEIITVEVDHPHVELSDDKAPQDASTAVHGSPTTTEHPNTVTCLSCNNDSDDDDKNDDDNDDEEQTNADKNRWRISSSDHHQLATSSPPASDSRNQEMLLSGPSMSSKSTSYVVEREKDASDGTNENNDQPAAKKAKEFDHLPAENLTLKHESISVVVTPAATTSSAVTVVRETTTAVSASAVTDKNHVISGHLLHHLTEGDGAHLSVGQQHLPATQHGFRTSPFRRRLLGHEFGEISPASSSLTCHRHRSHSLRMILAVFFAFVLTYLPFTVTNLADQQAVLDRSVYMLTSLAFWAGSCVNPLIYGIMNVQFRRAYVATVLNCWRHSVARFSTH